jgi:hypothetical protein
MGEQLRQGCLPTFISRQSNLAPGLLGALIVEKRVGVQTR